MYVETTMICLARGWFQDSEDNLFQYKYHMCAFNAAYFREFNVWHNKRNNNAINDIFTTK